MPTDAKLSKALSDALEKIPPVISDTEARPDYNVRPKLREMVWILNTYRQSLLNAQAQTELSDDTRKDLSTQSSDTVLPAIANLINLNVQITKMGQLNTNRTITPMMAKANNVNLAAEQSAVQNLVAQLQVSPTPPPRPQRATLAALEVNGAEQAKSGLYYQYYSKDQSVRVLAVTEPNAPDAWSRIAWKGGEADFSGAANLRSVPLSTLSTPGSPLTVSATLGGKTLSIELAVIPALEGLEVTGATTKGDGTWTLLPGSSGPISVKAITMPDSTAAYRFLSWKGGEPDTGGRLDARTVKTRDLSSGSLPVSVAIKVS